MERLAKPLLAAASTFAVVVLVATPHAADTASLMPDSSTSRKYGAIRVVSNPARAQVMLDGTSTGLVTPTIIRKVTPGRHSVEVHTPDYLFARRHIAVRADSTLSLSFELISLSDTACVIGELELGILALPPSPVKTPYLIDGRLVYSREVTLDTGFHHVAWEGGNRYSSLDTTVQIHSGRLTAFRSTPRRLTGRLQVSPFPPDAEVFLNGRARGLGDLDAVLPTETYELSIVRRGYYTQSEHVTLLPGERRYINIDLIAVPDRDNDGFLDSLDRCPDIYGLYGGCPKAKRHVALRHGARRIADNMRDDSLALSVGLLGYMTRRPTNRRFRDFVSYYNDGPAYFNNKQGLTAGDRYEASYKGLTVACRLGQWNTGLRYMKSDTLRITTPSGAYCVVHDSIAELKPRLLLPSTAITVGLHLKMGKLQIGYGLGLQFENIVITDLIREDNLSQYARTGAGRYNGPRTEIVFRNNWWFHELKCEVGLVQFNGLVPTFYAIADLSFGPPDRTGWFLLQAGILLKVFPQRIVKARRNPFR